MSETITFETRILSGADDVEQGTSGAVIFDSSDLEMAVDRTVVQTIGLRFTRIDIPQGAIITNAYIQFQTEEVQTGTASLQIRGEDSDDAAACTSASHNVSSRLKTDASVNWTPDPWGTIGETGLAQQTPNLAGIVQEIVNRSGWTPLNDIVFTVTGSGTRTAEAYEGGAAPILHIEYTLPSENDAGVGSISISDVMVTEGHSGTTTATFTVTRTGGTAAFSVNYATSNGTATAGSDYVAKSGTLSFASGQATQTVSVTINGDTTNEINETVFVNLSGNTNITDGQGIGTIRNDDVVSIENITFETRILSGADDVEQGTSGSVIFGSSDLEMAVDGTVVQTVGLRFTRIDIPQGAIITSAYIQFQTDEVKTGSSSLVIRGEDTGDAAAFTSASFNVTSRLMTDASVGWAPGARSTIGEAGLAQRSRTSRPSCGRSSAGPTGQRSATWPSSSPAPARAPPKPSRAAPPPLRSCTSNTSCRPRWWATSRSTM